MLNLSSLPELQYNGGPAFPPQEKDLQRLYDLIIESRALTVLELGCGYSTFVIAQALKENEVWFNALETKPEIRNANMFRCFSVDTNPEWIAECSIKRPPALMEYLRFCPSLCSAQFFMGQMCHYYNPMPDVVPDFIYLDGPDPKEVQGNCFGLSWQCPERTPMAADLLIMESTLLPGTRVLIDGRTNNARFLMHNFKRSWKALPNHGEDFTLLELDEARLGKINVIGRDILEWLNSQENKS